MQFCDSWDGIVTEIERTQWSIVLLGNFNPAIFHPAWFEANKLISKEQADVAETNVVHKEISSFSIGDITITAELNKFQIETRNAPEIRIFDFVSKCFGDILPHTKIHSFGVNKAVHFQASSPERRVEIGRELAPLAVWGEFGSRSEKSSGETVGGMASIRMKEIINDDESNGHLDVTVEPSDVVGRATGILAFANRHVSIADLPDTAGSDQAIRKLDKVFESALKQADEVIDNFRKLAV